MKENKTLEQCDATEQNGQPVLTRNSEYITGIDAFSDRTDYGTMEPFLKTMQRKHGKKNKAATADAGYERFRNDLDPQANGQQRFVKPANDEQQKSGSFKRPIGRGENRIYDAEKDSDTCARGRKLNLRGKRTELHDKRPPQNAHFAAVSSSYGRSNRKPVLAHQEISEGHGLFLDRA